MNHTPTDHTLKQALVDTAKTLCTSGLNQGSAGNVSVRAGEGFFITPSGLHPQQLTAADIPWMHLDGRSEGRLAPSSEWRFHRDLYRARPAAGAVLHAHSPHAVSLACLRRDIPAFHYMIARFGGDSVRCATYATFGTQALSDAAVLALQDRQACLLANHGFLLYGRDLPQALALGIELEDLCGQYWRACQLGQPVLLTPQEMAEVLERFQTYGQQPAQPPVADPA